VLNNAHIHKQIFGENQTILRIKRLQNKISIEKPQRILKTLILKQMKEKIMHPQRKQAIKRSKVN
jgi:hypothetical protein